MLRLYKDIKYNLGELEIPGENQWPAGSRTQLVPSVVYMYLADVLTMELLKHHGSEAEDMLVKE